MIKKTIGILVYYWPPAGGSGVQRWLRFSNHLSELGWDVHIFTFSNPQYPITDESLINNINPKIKVSRIKGFEVPRIFKKKSSAESYSNIEKNFFTSFLSFIRELFFFPDSRKFLIRPSIKFIKNYNKKHSLNYLITSGPPHSMHYVGLKIKEQTNIKWISDFRDPWSNFFQNKILNKLDLTQKKHLEAESKIIENSDLIFTSSKSLKFLKSKYNNQYFIPSGFRSFIKSRSYSKFRILYIGSMKLIQNPDNLWHVLYELIISNKNIRDSIEILLIGNIDNEIIKSKSFKKIKNYCQVKSYMPIKKLDYEISLSKLLVVSAINLPNSSDLIPGKFYHYLSSSKTILGFSNDGSDLQKIIDETSSGKSFNYNNRHSLKKFILERYKSFALNEEESKYLNTKYLSLNIAKKIQEIILKL